MYNNLQEIIQLLLVFIIVNILCYKYLGQSNDASIIQYREVSMLRRMKDYDLDCKRDILLIDIKNLTIA